MINNDQSIIEISGYLQNYDWGKKGSSSLVAKLSNTPIDENKPYAELWFGSHPSGPSKIVKTGETFQKDIPFLFKVLSVGKALSIQAHPDKKLAEQIHSERPDIYKDDNHKPEMAIALTPFEALVGFRQLEYINYFLFIIPALRLLVGFDECKEQLKSKDDLKVFFKKMMTSTKVKEACEMMREMESQHPLVLRFLELEKHYPYDVGCFCIFILNHIQLEIGESIFLGPNEPHAYLSGDCVECMANSDNVVRAGLTPKYRDLDLLIKMLTWNTFGEEELRIKLDKNTGVYETPVDEFAVKKHEISGNVVINVSTKSIFIVIDGEGKFNNNLNFKKGSAFYVENASVPISCEKAAIIFEAFSKK